MTFPGKMCLMIILKVMKNQCFTLSLEDTLFEKPREGWGGQIDPPPPPSCFRIKRGKLIKSVDLDWNTVIKDLEQKEVYKYLGFDEINRIEYGAMKGAILKKATLQMT